MESKMSGLHIDLPSKSQQRKNKKKLEVADSWEDEDLSSPVEGDMGDHTPTDPSDLASKPNNASNPALHPPPPTPISPRGSDQYIDWSTASMLGGGRPTPFSPSSTTASTPSDSDRERRRPEKSTATASRLIAAGLGMKAPQKSEEAKQYDRAIREQEIRRKNREKELQQREREADEKLKAAVWTD
ncbi:hypothetical protein B0A52_02265 [Exophiala mesophila]|uniref:Uncharacterized protein n=1 Tax=Exophiala mesophila TaxID=212818 RepID=A0A438NBX0_EXOME|nr:hypothetical protein B0A52_02265 [Exophiala mesophila]